MTMPAILSQMADGSWCEVAALRVWHLHLTGAELAVLGSLAFCVFALLVFVAGELLLEQLAALNGCV